MMNIVFDCRVILDGFAKNGYGRAGIYFAAFNLLRHLADRKDCQVTMYCGHFSYDAFSAKIDWAPKVAFWDNVELRLVQKYQCLKNKIEERKREDRLCSALVKKIQKNIIKLIYRCVEAIPVKVRYPGIDVFISPINKFPSRFYKENNIKKALWIYDLIPLINDMKEHKWFFEMIQSLNKSDIYFTDSISARKDLLTYKGHMVDSNRVFSIPLAASEEFYPKKDNRDIVFSKYGLEPEKKYIFSLCTLTERKNLLRVVRTFIQFIDKHGITDLNLVLGGGVVGTNREKLLKEVGNRSEIKFIGYVADEDLSALYSNAEWFVYTSSYEGFGLPPLEAMACGCPVITSNNSSLPEVVGDAGIQVAWDSDEQHIAAYEKYYFSNKFRLTMAHRGIDRAKMFDWAKTVDQMLKFLRATDIVKPNPNASVKNFIQRKNRSSFFLKLTQKIIGVGIKKLTKIKSNRNVVLLMDNLAEPKNNIQDNFTFFKYLFYKGDKELVPYYIINRESPYVSQLKNEFGDKILLFNPKAPDIVSLLSLLKLSKKVRYVCDSFQSIKLLGVNFAVSTRRSKYITTIFTQHGVNFFKPDFISVDVYGARVFDKVVCSNNKEKDLFLKRGKYHPLNVIHNGLFRWDNIDSTTSNKKSVLVFFTTRRYLSMLNKPGESEYCRKIISLINNVKLKNILAKNDVELKLALHHSAADYIRKHMVDANITIIGEDEVFDAKCSSSMLITDYSSMCFEFFYQNKPVIFYNFDDSLDCKRYGHVLDVVNPWSGKPAQLFDYTKIEDDVVSMLEKYIDNNFTLDELQLNNVGQFFYYRRDFCERFYEYIRSQLNII